MKNSELRRRLAKMGATFKEGAKHTKVYLNGKQTTVPRHAEDVGVILYKSILHRLDIKELP